MGKPILDNNIIDGTGLIGDIMTYIKTSSIQFNYMTALSILGITFNGRVESKYKFRRFNTNLYTGFIQTSDKEKRSIDFLQDQIFDITSFSTENYSEIIATKTRKNHFFKHSGKPSSFIFKNNNYSLLIRDGDFFNPVGNLNTHFTNSYNTNCIIKPEEFKKIKPNDNSFLNRLILFESSEHDYSNMNALDHDYFDHRFYSEFEALRYTGQIDFKIDNEDLFLKKLDKIGVIYHSEGNYFHRTVELVEKVSIILAISDNPYNPVISDSIVDNAIKIVTYSNELKKYYIAI